MVQFELVEIGVNPKIGVLYKIRDFRPLSRFISKTIQHRAIVTVERR